MDEQINISNQNKCKKNRKVLYIIIGILIIITIIIVFTLISFINTKNSNIFDTLKNVKTKEDVLDIIGTPDREENNYYYNGIYFANLKGELEICAKGGFYQEGEHLYYGLTDDIDDISIIAWKYNLDSNESVEDYWNEIFKIEEYFTKLYGEPTAYNYLKHAEWEDSDGNKYVLNINNKDEYVDYTNISCTKYFNFN